MSKKFKKAIWVVVVVAIAYFVTGTVYWGVQLKAISTSKSHARVVNDALEQHVAQEGTFWGIFYEPVASVETSWGVDWAASGL